MFLIRQAKAEDVPTLVKLAKMVHFINLPADRQIIEQKVSWSQQCFLMAAESRAMPTEGKKSRKGAGVKSDAAAGGNGSVKMGDAPARHHGDVPGPIASGLKSITGRSPLFMFVMEEHASGKGGTGAVGTSQVIAQISSPGQPNLSLELRKVEKFSQVLQSGVSHVMAKLHLDEEGPTEIGGLILQPSYRGHRAKLGRFLSLVRFHFMGLNREFFSRRVLAEMMGPVNADGQTPFWDGFTRAFINMSYEDADRFCQESKEFILSLFPREGIYLTLIPPEARACVAQVGPETVPARRMLEKLGFKYHNRIDPFDGGPHLECDIDQISIVRDTRVSRLGDAISDEKLATTASARGIVSVIDDDGEFRAVETLFNIDKQGRVIIGQQVNAALGSKAGADCGYTVLDTLKKTEPSGEKASKNGKAPKKTTGKRTARA
ncbi:MAG: arginine N-succinyltransferase [Phycisphaerales bacterium]|nr:arginine N-succinyltransferase [Phycisphaerales bacterium]